MRSIISFCSFEQYENYRTGVSLTINISKKSLSKILEIFGNYIEDFPHYHCQLRNACGELIYILFDIKK